MSLTGNIAMYYPESGFVGTDSFTYAAWDGSTDSNVGTVTVATTPGNCVLTATATAPAAALPGSDVPFGASASLTHCAGNFSYEWDFGDGSPRASSPFACHRYSTEGDHTWTLTVTSSGATQTVSGVVTISPTLGPPLRLSITPLDFTMLLSWPVDRVPTSVETTSDLNDPYGWQPVVDSPVSDGFQMSVETFVLPDGQVFRLRRVP